MGGKGLEITIGYGGPGNSIPVAFMFARGFRSPITEGAGEVAISNEARTAECTSCNRSTRASTKLTLT